MALCDEEKKFRQQRKDNIMQSMKSFLGEENSKNLTTSRDVSLENPHKNKYPSGGPAFVSQLKEWDALGRTVQCNDRWQKQNNYFPFMHRMRSDFSHTLSV